MVLNSANSVIHSWIWFSVLIHSYVFLSTWGIQRFLLVFTGRKKVIQVCHFIFGCTVPFSCDKGKHFNFKMNITTFKLFHHFHQTLLFPVNRRSALPSATLKRDYGGTWDLFSPPMSREAWWDIMLMLLHYICPIFNLFGFILAFKEVLRHCDEPDLFYMSTPVMKKALQCLRKWGQNPQAANSSS